MVRWSSPYFVGAVIAVVVVAGFLLVRGGFFERLLPGTGQPEDTFVPTPPEEKRRILESLPPIENPLSPEEKRAILERASGAQ